MKDQIQQEMKGCFEKYDTDNDNALSKELLELVEISVKHGEKQLETNVLNVTKKIKREAVMTLLKEALPSGANLSSGDFSVNTSNALFVYLLEKTAKVKGNPSRPFKMHDDWNLIFEKTRANEIFTKNKSYVFLEAYEANVEYANAKIVYQVIKETFSHYRTLKSQQGRRDVEKMNKRKLEDFLLQYPSTKLDNNEVCIYFITLTSFTKLYMFPLLFWLLERHHRRTFTPSSRRLYLLRT